MVEAMISLQQASVVIDEVELLPPTSIDVPEGAWHVLRGANGSGKSTLLNVVAGVLRPTSGTVFVAGSTPDERAMSFRTRVCAVLGSIAPARDLTLREQLAVVAETWSVPAPDARADEELAVWGIDSLRDRFPHELSSGQRQLFTLALGFVRPASILLLDEPEQRLDADRRATLIARLQERQASGTTLLIATHSDEVAAPATAITYLDR